MNRVRVFIDFWNFHLSVKAMMRLPIRVDWRQFGLRSAQALGQLPTLSLGGEMRCEGVHIYGSYSPSVKWETKLAKEMNEEVSLLPGLFPLFEKREKASSTRTCKECGKKVRLEPETGIDVRLAVDMIKLSNSEPDTIIILATNDADFIPLAEYLSGLGRRIVHLRTDKGNNKLSQCCWANVALEKLDRAAFPFEDKTMLLTVGAPTSFPAEMEGTLKKHAIEYDLCNLSSPSKMD